MRYQFRRGTTTEWTSNNPQLAAGEMGLEYTDNDPTHPPKIKIGAYGSTPGIAQTNVDNYRWDKLPYLSTGGSIGVDTTIAGSGSALVRSTDGQAMYYSDVLQVNNATTGTDGSINVKGAVIPAVPDTFSLGTTGARWASIYMNAAGTVNLGYTTLSDTDGALTLSGPVIPKTDAATLGTAAKPWNQLYMGSSKIDATNNKVCISTADSYLYNDNNMRDINTINTGTLLSVSISADGSKICYLDKNISTNETRIWITDGSGNNASKIISSTAINFSYLLYFTIIDATITRDGKKLIFIAKFYNNTNLNRWIYKTYTYIIETDTIQSFDIDYRLNKCVPNADGTIIVLYTSVDSTDLFPQIYSNGIQMSFDNVPSLDYLVSFTNIGISDDGTRIALSYYVVENGSLYGNMYNYIVYRSRPGFYTCYTIPQPVYRTINISNDGTKIVGGGFIDSNNIYEISSSPIHIRPIQTTDTSLKVNDGYDIPSSYNKWQILYINNDNIVIGVDSDKFLRLYNLTNNSNIQVDANIISSLVALTNNLSSTSIITSSSKKPMLSIFNNKKIQTTTAVGIGTNTPAARLEIANPAPTTESTALMLRNSGTMTRQSVSASFATDATTAANAKILVDGSANATMRFLTTTNGVLTEKLRLDASGTMQINTSTYVSGNMYAANIYAGNTLLNISVNPIGTINMYCSITNLPNGWLLCNGQELLRSSYPELFTIISTSFGIPTDNTKFKIPNMSGKFPYGSSTIGTSGGSTTVSYSGSSDGHALTIGQLPSHAHPASETPHVHGPVGYWNVGSAAGDSKQAAAVNAIDWSRSAAESLSNGDKNNLMYSAKANVSVGNTGNNETHSHGINFTLNNVIPPYIGLAYIIYTGRTTQ